MPTYSVQLTEGSPNEFLWRGLATDEDHAVTRARQAFEHERGRPPQDVLVSLERVSDSDDGNASGSTESSPQRESP